MYGRKERTKSVEIRKKQERDQKEEMTSYLTRSMNPGLDIRLPRPAILKGGI